MTTPSDQHVRLLAVDPCTKGFGFAVLETPDRLLDWGVARVWGHNDEAFLARFEVLLLRYLPTVTVVEEHVGYRRSARSVSRINAAVAHALEKDVKVIRISRGTVTELFASHGHTKHAMATAISELFPEIRIHLPSPRKPWMSEDERMNLFDAVGLLLAAIHPDTILSSND